MTECPGYRYGVSGGGDHGGQREREEEPGVSGRASHGPGRRLAEPRRGPGPGRDPVPRQLDAARVDADFRDFVRTRGRALLRSAYLLTGNLADAEDLVQSALAKTYLAWERIQDRKALEGYVRRAIVNTHISWWRRRRVDEYPTDEIPDQPAADTTGNSELHDTLQRALDRLPQRMRAAVVLRYFEDMTEAEVADALGVSQGTVKSTVSRAVAKLRSDSDLLAE
jgi:RNA polymerase sigma-70 factor (sigma-E family)